jgi:ABC-type Fe3+-siderophore transport system permease subunit
LFGEGRADPVSVIPHMTYSSTGTRRRMYGLPLLAVCLGYFMVILDAAVAMVATVVTIAVPVIVTRWVRP